jgi:hypothetical protein
MENKLIKMFDTIILLGIVGLLIMGMYGLITEQYGITYVSFVMMMVSITKVVLDPYKD